MKPAILLAPQIYILALIIWWGHLLNPYYAGGCCAPRLPTFISIPTVSAFIPFLFILSVSIILNPPNLLKLNTPTAQINNLSMCAHKIKRSEENRKPSSIINELNQPLINKNKNYTVRILVKKLVISNVTQQDGNSDLCCHIT